MPFELNEEGKVTQKPMSFLKIIKGLSLLAWYFFIVFNAASFLVSSIVLLYMTGNFNALASLWLTDFALSLVLPPILIGFMLLCLSPDLLLSKYCPSYKERTDFGKLFRTLSGLLYFAGRQVANAGDKELDQLVKLRARLDDAIQHATNCQREKITLENEAVAHE